MNIRVLSLFFSLLFTNFLVSQMTLHPGNTPPLTSDNIIENVFLGNGIELQKTRFTGTNASIGLFDNAEAEIGINKGIVLSTGYAQNVIKPNSANTPISSNTTGRAYTDSDLEAIAGVEVVDIVKFEITFVPSSDIVSFRYVFASEEYPDFVCADKNDVFGFFISGKKPGGGNYNAENIAVVPDPTNGGAYLDLPVSINTVNGGQAGIFSGGNCDEPNESLNYSQYYNTVAEGSSPALNAFLDVFVAQAEVIPCETYTIKIVLGDGNDQNEDSVVFLEERSFSTGTLTIDVNNPGIDGGLAEGCDDGSLRLHLPDAVKQDFPIELDILTGPEFIDAAVPGEDFMDLPDNLFIPAGESFIDLDLQPISDNIDEGTEFIYIKVRKSICNVDTLILPLYNNNLESVELPDTIFTCKSKTFELEADLGDNVNPSSMLTFENKSNIVISSSDNHTESLIEVFGLKDISLTPSIIAEVCIDSLVHPRLNDLDIYLRAPSDQVLELSTDNGNRADNEDQVDAFIQTCFSLSGAQNINYGNPSEGDLDNSNPSYTGSFLPEGSFDDWLSPITSTLNGEYGLYIVDDKNEFDGELFSWHISFNPKYNLDYTWSPSADLECADCEIAEGTGDESKYYYISLTDSYGCTYVDSVWVEVSKEAEAPIVTCETLTTGSIRYTWLPTANADFYEFSLNGSSKWISTEQLGMDEISLYEVEVTGPTSVVVSGLLEQETMTLEVRANNSAGCRSEANSSTCTTISCTGTLPVVNAVNISQPVCASEKRVKVEIDAVSTALPLTYRIDVITTSASNNDGLFHVIPQGTWMIRIIDNNGCAIDQEITVNTPDPISLNEVVTPITCAGDTDASITLDASGNYPPFEYAWNDGDTRSQRIDLGPNFYTVTVTDEKGCTAVEDFHIINPKPLEAIYVQSESLNCAASNEVSASLDITGGYLPYEIIWNGVSTEETLSSLRPGTIDYVVTDDAGCQISATEEVLQVDGLVLEFSNQSELTCFDSSDGTVTTSVTNGTAPYSYLWQNGEVVSDPIALMAGSNSVTVTDKNGCMVTSEIVIVAPTELVIQSESKGPSCYNERDAEISIEIDNQGDIEILWEDGSTSKDRTQLLPGTYCVTVTNENECTAKKCIEIEETEELTATYSITKVGCNNSSLGSIDLAPIGGSGEYLYNWKGPDGFTSSEEDLTDLEIGTYTVILSDKNNPRCNAEPINLELTVASDIQVLLETVDPLMCHGDSNGTLQAVPSSGAAPYNYQWSKNGTTDILRNLEAGAYTVTVTDSDNCAVIATIELEQPEEFLLSSTKQDAKCYGDESGSINLEAEGGTMPYQYQWNNGTTTGNQNQISAGNYNLTLTDGNGCTYYLTERINQPENPIITEAIVDEVSCSEGSNGSITLSSDNGLAPYKYKIDDSPFLITNSFGNLPAGIYQIETEDSNGCKEQLDVEVLEAEPIEVVFMNELSVTYGDDLQLDIEIRNSLGEMNYTWDAPSIDNFSCTECANPMITNVTSSFSGSLMITDDQDCESEVFFNVNVIEDARLAVPSGFSPNGDNVNDILYVMGSPDIQVTKFEIYSRLGDLVYRVEDFNPGDISTGWDGTYGGEELPQDSYIWVIECNMPSGSVEITKGQTTLIK